MEYNLKQRGWKGVDGGSNGGLSVTAHPTPLHLPLLLFPISMQLITYKTAPFPTLRNLSPSSPNLQCLFKASPVQEVGQVGICQPWGRNPPLCVAIALCNSTQCNALYTRSVFTWYIGCILALRRRYKITLKLPKRQKMCLFLNQILVKLSKEGKYPDFRPIVLIFCERWKDLTGDKNQNVLTSIFQCWI